MSTHTLSVLVEDRPGVLARLASLFSRRGYNILSLALASMAATTVFLLAVTPRVLPRY